MNSEKLKRTLTGRITSNKMDKTVTVLVERRIKHPLYGKFVIRSKKYHAHVVDEQLSVGDIVLIEECRPLSKTKNWKVVKHVNSISER
ncbi:30S ribosomal protein S17 [Nitrosomonas oligotropha]|jgi:small subunit ribosomal protein S17|uniref:30S ribosomal protein S17 n=1 Tax=Nitrosomonas oligotropha TaxID=42354 RepID=UPI001368E32F|nr:30S ribosomal protein S17 [Nitrosomonas oligotropha]MXS82670.1 30S ribosomal protein S17 [Nitrosomonas oligotropha]